MSFDTLAPYYLWMERLIAGRILQRCRTAYLDEVKNVGSVLLVGEGHGRFLRELCRANPHTEIDCVDISAGMNRVAQQALLKSEGNTSRVNFHTSAVLCFEPDRKFDLIATQFFLDCFNEDELRAVIEKLASWLNVGGRWLVTDFQLPQSGWERQRARLVLGLAYTFFRFATQLPARALVAPAPHFRRQGLICERRREFNHGLLYAEIWQRPPRPPAG